LPTFDAAEIAEKEFRLIDLGPANVYDCPVSPGSECIVHNFQGHPTKDDQTADTDDKQNQ
jgi:hypothetical protein